MKSAHGYVLVYSIRDQSTFNDVSDMYDQIIRVKEKENLPIILAGLIVLLVLFLDYTWFTLFLTSIRSVI
jgi:hypothetical protein